MRVSLLRLAQVANLVLGALVGPRWALAANPDASFLPDDAVLARVEDRTIRVFDFRERYFASSGEFRPSGDSLGRVVFLTSMINKEVLGLTALETNRSLDFEDRLIMRQHTNTVVQNILYKRLVLDSLSITEPEIERLMPQFGYEQRLQALTFRDPAVAAKVRGDLVRGRISWNIAVARHSPTASANPTSDLGWVQRHKFKGDFAIKVFDLLPSRISEVLKDTEGYRIVRCSGRRKSVSPPREFARTLIMADLRQAKTAPFLERFYDRVRALSHISYDSTNIRWAASKFKEAQDAHGSAGSIDMTHGVPAFADADTARVLARTRTREITIGKFMTHYASIPALFRTQLVALEPFIFAFDGPVLEPERVELGMALGIEKDPEAEVLIERRREQLLVQHLFQDSVQNRLVVTAEMRRKYYRDHEPEFVTNAKVRYAKFLRPDLASAETLVARLRAGENPEEIVHANELRGDDSTASIDVAARKDQVEFEKILFEELRPGGVTKVGPDREGKYWVLALMTFDPERKLAYEEVRTIVDESAENIESERLLKEFIARRREKYRIEWWPERVAGIRLTDPGREPPSARR